MRIWCRFLDITWVRHRPSVSSALPGAAVNTIAPAARPSIRQHCPFTRCLLGNLGTRWFSGLERKIVVRWCWQFPLLYKYCWSSWTQGGVQRLSPVTRGQSCSDTVVPPWEWLTWLHQPLLSTEAQALPNSALWLSQTVYSETETAKYCEVPLSHNTHQVFSKQQPLCYQCHGPESENGTQRVGTWLCRCVLHWQAGPRSYWLGLS